MGFTTLHVTKQYLFTVSIRFESMTNFTTLLKSKPVLELPLEFKWKMVGLYFFFLPRQATYTTDENGLYFCRFPFFIYRCEFPHEEHTILDGIPALPANNTHQISICAIFGSHHDFEHVCGQRFHHNLDAYHNLDAQSIIFV